MIFDSLSSKIEPHENFTVSWSVPKVGFGQFYFYKENNEWKCSNECMSKEFIKRILCDFVDNLKLDC